MKRNGNKHQKTVSPVGFLSFVAACQPVRMCNPATTARFVLVIVTLFFATFHSIGQTSNSSVIPDETVISGVACGCYFWEGQTYTQSGSYSTLVPSSTGQDSLVRLVLTVMQPDTSYSTVNACTAYTWNGSVYTASGRYYQLLSRNTVGCDSVAVLDLSVFPIPAAPTLQVIQPTCFAPTGSVLVTEPSGEGFQYSLDGTNFQLSPAFSGLGYGEYTVFVRSSVGCISSATTVTVLPVPQAPPAPVASVVQPDCFGMTGSVSVTAPVRPDYEYAIDGGSYQSARYFSGLMAGVHTVSVIDSNGCESTSAVILTEPAALIANSSSTAIACFGGTATVTVSASGGTSPYTGVGIFTVATGTYSYNVTDSKGCTASSSVTVAEPFLLVAANSSTQISCNGGNSTVTVIAAGGTAPYTGTGTYSVPAGTYTYSVLDSRGCVAVTNVILNQPTAITVMATSSVINCFGQTSSVTVGAVGGTAPYTGTGTYAVSAGTYTYTVTDNAGCTATRTVVISQPTALNAYANSAGIACNGQTANVQVTATGGTPQYTGVGTYAVSAGPYTYTVTDANGCTARVGIIITEPPVLAASATVASPLLCNGGTGMVSVAANGGTAPYTGTGLYPQSAGTTTYTVIDNNGCSSTSSVTLVQPSAISGTMVVTNATCSSPGSATVSITGGTAPYAYLWSTGATTATATGLQAGSYSVTVTDQVGCTRVFTCTIRLNAIYPGLAGSITGQTTVRANATFTYSILPVSGATSYRWTLPANCTGFSTTTSINVTFQTGFLSGSICVTPVNACGDGGTSCKAVTVPTITGTGGGKVKDKIPTGLGSGFGSILDGDSITATDGGSSGISINPSDENGAESRSDLGSSEQLTEAIRNLVAYPNPSRGKIVIGFNGLKDEKYLMQLTDMSGNLIAELTVTGQEEMCQILYDTSILAAGVYNLSVTKADGSQRRTIRLVVQ